MSGFDRTEARARWQCIRGVCRYYSQTDLRVIEQQASSNEYLCSLMPWRLAAPFERQALIKLRHIAGDSALGHQVRSTPKRVRL